jgi:transposase-like protein
VGWQQRKSVCAELRNIYAAPTEQAGLAELEAFEGSDQAPLPSSTKR